MILVHHKVEPMIITVINLSLCDLFYYLDRESSNKKLPKLKTKGTLGSIDDGNAIVEVDSKVTSFFNCEICIIFTDDNLPISGLR